MIQKTLKLLLFTSLITFNSIAQKNMIRLQIMGMNDFRNEVRSSNNNSSIAPDLGDKFISNYKNRLLNWQLGYTRKFKENLRYGLNFSYHPNNIYQLFDQFIDSSKNIKSESNTFHKSRVLYIEPNIGRVYEYNRFLFEAQASIPFIRHYDRSNNRSYERINFITNEVLSRKLMNTDRVNYNVAGIQSSLNIFYQINKKFLVGFGFYGGLMHGNSSGTEIIDEVVEELGTMPKSSSTPIKVNNNNTFINSGNQLLIGIKF